MNRLKAAVCAMATAVSLISAFVLPSSLPGHAQSGPDEVAAPANNPGMAVEFEFSWGVSAGYVFAPHARVMRSPPGWIAQTLSRKTPVLKRRPALAIVAQPIDSEHSMFRGSAVERFCIADASSLGVTDALCTEVLGSDGRKLVGFNYRLCMFDPDCLHATAAALISSGARMPDGLFGFETVSRNPTWNMTSDVHHPIFLSSGAWPMLHKNSDSLIAQDFPSFPRIYEERGELGTFGVFFSSDGEEPELEAADRLNDRWAAILKNGLPKSYEALYDGMRDTSSVNPTQRASLMADAKTLLRRIDRALPPPSVLDKIPLTDPDHYTVTRIANFRALLDEMQENATTEQQVRRIIAAIEAIPYLDFVDENSALAAFDLSVPIALIDDAGALSKQIAAADGLDLVVFHALEKLRGDFLSLPDYAFPIAEAYSLQGTWYSAAEASLLNANMIIDHGARPGGPLLAVNVSSRVEEPATCQRLGRNAPCLLTRLEAQNEALQFILLRARNRMTAPSDQIGAVLLNGAGGLVNGPCDSDPLAKTIAALRREGIYTFVPAGNDGDIARVQYPGCVSEVIVVGALNRDGDPLEAGNGAENGMVDLWIDGDTVVLPMRAPPPKELAGCLKPDAFRDALRGLQARLATLDIYDGPLDGHLNQATRRAVDAFQKSNALRRSGILDWPTLSKLAKIQIQWAELEKLGHDLEPDGPVEAAARSVHWGQLESLEGYRRLICGDSQVQNEYQAYFAGGTLVSAAAAAGIFLDLVDRFPAISPHQIIDEMLTGGIEPARLWSVEDFRTLEDRLTSRSE